MSEHAHSKPDERLQLKTRGQSNEQVNQATNHPPTDMDTGQPDAVQQGTTQDDQEQPASDLGSPMEGQASAPPPKHPIGPEGGEELPAPKRRRVFLPRAAKETSLMDQSD